MFETIVDLCFFFDVVVQFRLAYFVYGTNYSSHMVPHLVSLPPSP